MKKVCPECGFEIQEGDVFCMNCGASFDEEEIPEEKEEKPKKKFNPVPLIIIGGVLVALLIAVLILFNTPQAIFLRAGYKAVKEISEDETLQRANKILNGGSAQVSAEIADIASDFKIPLISQIDATATAKYYMNQEESKSMLKVTGSLGGTTALGAELWISPEELVVRSNTLLGKKAYGIDLEDNSSRDEAKEIFKNYLGIDADGYDEILDLVQAYEDDKEDITPKLAKQLVIELIKNAEWKKDSETIEIKSEPVDTTVIYMTVDKERFKKIVGNLYDFAEKDEDFEDVLESMERGKIKDEIEDAINELDDDFEIKYTYYIDSEMNIVRQDSEVGETGSSFVRFPDGEGFEFTTDGEAELNVRYDVEVNDESNYKATLKVDDFSVDAFWNKDSGKWRVQAGLLFAASGTMKVEEEEITGVINKVGTLIFDVQPNAEFVIKNEDKMPECPEYKSINEAFNFEEIVNSVKESIMGMIMKFMPQPEPEPEPEEESGIGEDGAVAGEGAEGGAGGAGGTAGSEDAATAEERKSIPVSGTYEYSEGQLAGTVTLNSDGSYKLTFSNSGMSYNDTGTYKRYEDDTMEFASDMGINATGKYKDSSIEVTISGFGTFELKKKN